MITHLGTIIYNQFVKLYIYIYIFNLIAIYIKYFIKMLFIINMYYQNTLITKYIILLQRQISQW
jgi:hypothetical protein